MSTIQKAVLLILVIVLVGAGVGLFAVEYYPRYFKETQLPDTVAPMYDSTTGEKIRECLSTQEAGQHNCEVLLKLIVNYNQCAESGFPIMESDPQQCATPDGRTFTQGIAKEHPPSLTEPMSLKGNLACLPHKDTTGPVTLECAFGLKTLEGDYYALDTTMLPQGKLSEFTFEQTLTIDGLIVPLEAVSSDHWKRYNIKGIVQVSLITAQ